MFAPQAEAAEAMAKTGVLLKYAAESLSETEQKSALASVSLDLEQSRLAAEQQQWTPDVATKFWTSYNNLCSLISPVSVDTLTTSKTEREHKSWFGSSYTDTLPQRVASRYLWLLFALLFLSVVLSFLTSTVTTTNSDIKSLTKSGDLLAQEIALGLSLMRTKGVGDDDDFTKSMNTEVQATAVKVTTALSKLYATADQLYGKTASLIYVTRGQYPVCGNGAANGNYCYPKADSGGISKEISNAEANLANYYLLTRRASDLTEQAQTSANWIGSTILPVLLGMTGACAYIVRMLAEQIRTSSFSSTSNIRHSVRLILGALAGVAIGFGGIVVNNSVSAGALSFLAGYAIEPVFAAFDNIAAKLK